MQFSPMLALHIAGGTLGLLSGFAAAFLRKGSNRHRITGNVFVVSMLMLGGTGGYLGFMKHQIVNPCMGILTAYLVITAWWTARRRDGRVGSFDKAALMVPLALSAFLFSYGFGFMHSPTSAKSGDVRSAFFIFGFLSLFFAIGDLRMLVRGSITGTQRLARHLSRMCLSLFVAAGSVFIARAHLFPVFMRKSGMLFALSFLPLLLIIFWRVRLRSRKRYQENPVPRRTEAYAVRA
ncbi:MAG: hypothetical protein DMG65_15275 [Candidatus Angelobacter sp. Gp1-AA117]|nr:MAG: hypothetical protein DMG65_15275 [Candidatus Angelobacter sp. Gp1-AA117]